MKWTQGVRKFDKILKKCYDITNMTEMTVGQSISSGANSFFERHQDTLAVLFDAMGVEKTAANSLEAAIAATQAWVPGDHTKPAVPIHIPEGSEKVLQELYTDLGLTDERTLPSGRYDQLLVLGGFQLGNIRRMKFTKKVMESGVLTNHIVLLGGERQIDPVREIPYINQNMVHIIRGQTASPDPWIRDLASGEARLRWETGALRLAATASLGELALIAYKQNIDNPQEQPERQDFAQGNRLVTLLHTKAVARPQGETRHTTEACIAHWLCTVDPPAGSTVGFVTANPYMERTARVVARQIHRHGRADIKLVVGGPAPSPTVVSLGYNREIAYNLYEDGLDAGII